MLTRELIEMDFQFALKVGFGARAAHQGGHAMDDDSRETHVTFSGALDEQPNSG